NYLMSAPLPISALFPYTTLFRSPQAVPVVDTGNYYPGMRDPQIPDIDAEMPQSVWVSKQLGRPVIKAFNNILAHSLAELGGPERSEEHTSELQSRSDLVCRLQLE